MVPLRGSQQGIEQGQVRRLHDHVRGGREVRTSSRQGDRGRRGQRAVARQQHPQGIVHRRLAVPGRVPQEAQVLLGPGPLAVLVPQPVVGDAEAAGREQVLAVAVVGERPRLADQRVDDVPVLDGVLVPAGQSGQRVHQAFGVPHFDPVGVQPGLDRHADQPAVDRVGVAVDVDEAARVHPALQAQAAVEPPRRQRPERRAVRLEPRPPPAVPLPHHTLHERDVLVAAGEVTAAADQQRLIEGRLEVAVGRLVVAVLVRLAHVDPLAREAVMLQEAPVPPLELALRRQVVDGGAEAVAAVPPRHAAQVPEGVLQPVGQRLERLRRAHRHRLPVRVGQHEVVHQVIERLPADRNAQIVHAGEVRRRQVPGLMHLAEHDRPVRAERRPPLADAPLERPPLAGIESARVLGLEPLEEGLGHQPGLGRQPSGHGRPDLGERVPASAVGARLLGGAGQRPPRAVLACRLLVHAGPPGRLGQWSARSEITQQLAHLGIRDHRTPPGRRCERDASAPSPKRQPASREI